MEPTFDHIEAIMSAAGSLTGIPTGYPDLDEMTGGLQNGELVILAARPSMGRRRLALNVARKRRDGPPQEGRGVLLSR